MKKFTLVTSGDEFEKLKKSNFEDGRYKLISTNVEDKPSDIVLKDLKCPTTTKRLFTEEDGQLGIPKDTILAYDMELDRQRKLILWARGFYKDTKNKRRYYKSEDYCWYEINGDERSEGGLEFTPKVSPPRSLYLRWFGKGQKLLAANAENYENVRQESPVDYYHRVSSERAFMVTASEFVKEKKLSKDVLDSFESEDKCDSPQKDFEPYQPLNINAVAKIQPYERCVDTENKICHFFNGVRRRLLRAQIEASQTS